MIYFKVFQSNGVTLVHTFSCVFQANYPYSTKNIIEHMNPRAKGSLIISGGDAPWNLTLRGVVFGTDYSDIIDKLDAMEAIAINTPYVLKIMNDAVADYTYNVKRITPIIYDPVSLKTDYSEYEITFRVNAY